MSTHKKAPFIVFEGIDGSGKSTQISYLKERIEQSGTRCYVTREPSDGPIGCLIRQYLAGRMQADESALAALFVADRLDHLTNPIDGLAAKTEAGIAVISDRYYLSNYAYNGVRVPLEWVLQANSLCAGILHPDCHIFIDISPDAALERIGQSRFDKELYETRERLSEFRDAFFQIFDTVSGKETIHIIDGSQTPEQIAQAVWEHVQPYFSE